MQQVQEAEAENQKLTAELAQYQECNPEVLDEKSMCSVPSSASRQTPCLSQVCIQLDASNTLTVSAQCMRAFFL